MSGYEAVLREAAGYKAQNVSNVVTTCNQKPQPHVGSHNLQTLCSEMSNS